MLNLEESLSDIYTYNIQKDLYLKGILYVGGAISILELLTSQISEINLLQLVPGFYLFLVLLSFALLMITSTFSFRVPFKLDSKNGIGSKTITRMDSYTQLMSSLVLFIGLGLISLNTIVPIGLDSFDAYDEETLSNVWSFEEVLSLETILLTILLILSQSPTVVITRLHTEKEVNQLPEYWRNLSFFMFVFAGVITPTIDGYTQVTFAFSAISLFAIIVTLSKKRVYIPFNSTICLNF